MGLWDYGIGVLRRVKTNWNVRGFERIRPPLRSFWQYLATFCFTSISKPAGRPLYYMRKSLSIKVFF
jgi:hypothetical protein